MLDSTDLLSWTKFHCISILSAKVVRYKQMLGPASFVWSPTVPHCTPPVSRVPSLVPVIQFLGRALHQFDMMEADFRAQTFVQHCHCSGHTVSLRSKPKKPRPV